MDFRLNTSLRKEESKNVSGRLLNHGKIELLKEKDYYVEQWPLDGDAPKQFIKVYFYSKNSGVRRDKPTSWLPFIAKSAEKWYPHESVIEYMINRIGLEMGLRMNEVKLVRGNGQIRFLSKYFLSKNEVLIHGAELCGEHLGDMALAQEIAQDKETARDLFTFEFIQESLKSVFPASYDSLLVGLVQMIAFDALVGNNDRHFYNWGVIDNKKQSRKSPRFAPLYDSARGLLWNLSDANIVHYQRVHNEGGNKVVNYIENAYPRISIEENKAANHFELVAFIKGIDPKFALIVESLASVAMEQKVIEMLKRDFFQFFVSERSQLIELIIRHRFNRIRNI